MLGCYLIHIYSVVVGSYLCLFAELRFKVIFNHQSHLTHLHHIFSFFFPYLFWVSSHWSPGVGDSSGWCTFLWASTAQSRHFQKGQSHISETHLPSTSMQQTIPLTLTFYLLFFFPPQGLEFRELLFTKLINAEYACYKAEKFAKLEVSAAA